MKKAKIKSLQLDPFGYCNAKCWFCPVKYFPQPEEGLASMSIDLAEKILKEIYEEKNKIDGIVHPNFGPIAFSHYNEILLYKRFEELLALLRKYSFKCMILSNGVSLSPDKTDLLKEYKDVVIHLGLNVPAFEKDLWAKRSGFSPDSFDRLMKNIKYAEENLQHLGNEFMMIVNGIDDMAFIQGHVTKGDQFDQEEYSTQRITGEHETQFQLAKKLFKNIQVVKGCLYDRAGLIDHIISNKEMIQSFHKGKKVIGCMNGGDRTTDWLHVNSAGNVFLCCNDYNFDYKYGNLKQQSIKEVWESEERKIVIEKAFGEICANCYFAKVR
jgi:radical SAM protein with 4Fe4S-binding SPASM domain